MESGYCTTEVVFLSTSHKMESLMRAKRKFLKLVGVICVFHWGRSGPREALRGLRAPRL